jgi:hypothetical protein
LTCAGAGRAAALGAAVVFAIAGIAGGSLADEGEPLRLDATNKLEYRRLDQGDVREEAFRNRLEVSGDHGIFSAWIRLESLQLSNASVYDPYGVADEGFVGEQRVDETALTRRLFTAEAGGFRVQAGDVSHVFGRGLALSVFEDEELNFDTRLEGVRAQIERDAGSASVVAGSRDGNRFRGVFVEPRALGLGGVLPGGRARLGASFAEGWGATQNTDVLPRERQAGGLAEVTAGPATVYGEWVERSFPGKDGRGALGKPGRGAFVAGEVTVSRFTLSAEHRDFFRFEHRFHDPPPTLRQHPWTSLNRVNGQVLSDIPDDDVNGTLVQAEWAPGSFTVVQGSWARLTEDDGPDEFTEVYGEGKSTWREQVFLTAAAAESELRIGTTVEERISGLGEAVVELSDVNSLSLGLEWTEAQASDDLTAAFRFPVRFQERIASVSWGRSPWLNLTVTHEDTDEDDPAEARDDWTNVLAEVQVADGHDVVLSYGSERGGWKCTGGVCFFEPEFEGMKVKWVGRF